MEPLLTTHVQWVTASPFWTGAAAAADANERAAFRQPALLRFATDSFMQDFIAMLASNPAQITQLRARHETWRKPGAVHEPPPRSLIELVRGRQNGKGLIRPAVTRPALVAPPPPATAPLKLYQPAHQRYYLVAGCLVCRVPGLPDRTLDIGNGERVSFVMRRLHPAQANGTVDPSNPATYTEFALVGREGNERWQLVVSGRNELLPAEEQLPLFPLHFVETDNRTRRLCAGLVPVGRREAYLGAPQATADGLGVVVPADSIVDDPRTVLVRSQVIEPWKSLIDQAERARASANQYTVIPNVPVPSDDEKKALQEALRQNARPDLQLLSWYILLDFAKYLDDYIPKVWKALTGEHVTLTTGEAALLTALQTSAIKAGLGAALKQIVTFEDELDGATGPYPDPLGQYKWPTLAFTLVNLDQITDRPSADLARARVEDLADLLKTALPSAVTTPLPPLPLAARPIMAGARDPWFVIRLVFERPHCGPLQPVVMSAATEPFQLAGFFDHDAPARPIRIALPLDTTPGGLRKFDKNTAFMISDILCGQIDRVKNISFGDLVLSVLPWPFHKDLDKPKEGACPEGTICSLSIPIITLCALILLIIIVTLLDIIFHWLPFFIFCFKWPKFKAKG